MARYFLEVSYKGTHYSGFQIQRNGITIQSEVEKAIKTIQRATIDLTGSSRTDAGVHAFQNYFHFDYEDELHPQFLYKLNAILPLSIAVRNLLPVPATAHCRFDAVSRDYRYQIHQAKNPFKIETSLFYPYRLNLDALKEASSLIKEQTNFYSFSKANTQVQNFNCTIKQSLWETEDENLIYHIEANRFLRGMVRQIVGTLLKVGREAISIQQFKNLLLSARKSGYSLPPQGLHLKSVCYPQAYFKQTNSVFRNFSR